MRKLKPRSIALLALALAFVILPAQSQAPSPTDLQVKAAFLYKFGAFVQWPNASSTDTFAICVLGHDPFGPVLDSTLNGESVGGKKLVAVRITEPQQAAQCSILYVSSSEESRLRAVLAALNKLPVLTISDIPRFADRGGMIQFVLENGRVRFAVNVASAEKSGLTLSSQLLKVASSVKRNEGHD
jgi:hypothetical protein